MVPLLCSMLVLTGCSRSNHVGAIVAAPANKQICINNLRVIEKAVLRFKIEHKKLDTDPVTLQDLSLYITNRMVCPSSGSLTMEDSYAVTDCQTLPTCISAGGGPSHGHVLK